MFSIVVPMYNSEKYIDKCLESLNSQDIDDYEVIIVDDGSSDDSINKAKIWVNRSDKMKLIIKEKNGGLSETRNIGINAASRKYLMFVDSDDYIEKNSLGALRSKIIDGGFPDVMYAGMNLIDGVTTSYFGYVSSPNTLFKSFEFMKSELRNRNLFAMAQLGIYKRDIIVRNGVFFEKDILHEDELWTPMFLFACNNVYTSKIVFYNYVKHQGSITRAKDKTKNGIDLMNTSVKLDSYINNLDDKELVKLMKNHVAKLYMKGMARGRLYRKAYRNQVDSFFPIKRTCFLYDTLKAILFATNLKLYYYIDQKVGTNE